MFCQPCDILKNFITIFGMISTSDSISAFFPRKCMAVLGIISTFPIPYKHCTEKLFYQCLFLLYIIYPSTLLRSCPLSNMPYSLAIYNSYSSEEAFLQQFCQSLLAALLLSLSCTSDFFVSHYRFLRASGSLPGILIPNFFLAHGKRILAIVSFVVGCRCHIMALNETQGS